MVKIAMDIDVNIHFSQPKDNNTSNLNIYQFHSNDEIPPLKPFCSILSIVML
jgi:hypothetical protein